MCMISLGHPWPDLAACRKEFFNKLLAPLRSLQPR